MIPLAIVAGVANRLDLSEREAYIAVQSLGHSGGVDALIREASPLNPKIDMEADMSPNNRVAVVGVFFVAALATANLGCGGSSAPPPPPISISLNTTSATQFETTSLPFTATLVNDVSAKGIIWTASCSASACGSVSPSATQSGVPTTYTAPGPPASDLTVTLKATAVADPSKSASAIITVPALSVSVSPTSATVQVAGSLQINGSVNNDAGAGSISWTLVQNGSPCSPGCGTVSPASGTSTTYTAPAIPPASDMTVTATGASATDSTKSASATLLVPSIGIAVAPATSTVVGTQSMPLTATLVNDKNNQGVNWTVSCASAPCGTVSPSPTKSGVATTYTAPAPPASDTQVTVTTTSVADSNAVASATVTVPAILIDVVPPNPTVIATMTQAFTATVTNDPNNAGVTWSVSCSATSCGMVSPSSSASGGSVTYTAPPLSPTDLTVSVTATSVTNTANSTQVSVTVPAIVVSAVKPASGIVPISGTPQFTASVSNDPTSQGLNWTLKQGGSPCSPGCGTMNPASTGSPGTSTFNGPATLPANAAVSVNAVSITDATKLSSASITLTNGTAQFTPASLKFSCKLNSSLNPCPPPAQSVALTNTGASALSITSITTSGGFSQTNNCGSSVAPAGTCSITVTFTSKTVGTSNGSVTVTDSSSDSPQLVKLSGVVQRPRLTHADQARADLGLTNSLTVPAPTGGNVVGSRVFDLVDSGRKDPYTPNAGARELSVRVWYPVSARFSQDCKMAEYASPKVWKYFAQLVGVPAFPVSTNSCQDATVAEGAHPVVVFSPGLTGTFTDYTFLMEDLASRGYITVTVDHTYEATAVEFSDGRFVRSVVGSHLGGEVPRDRKTLSFAVEVRLKDLRFVIDQLARLNVRRDSPFSGRLDLSKIAVAGHSLGGLTALLTSQSDPHIKGAILIDPVLPDLLPGATDKPVLLMTADRQQWAANECGLWMNLHGSRLAVSLQGSEHVALSDWIWLTKDAVRTGPMGPEKTMSAMRDYVAAFLDTNLRGIGTSPLVNGPSPNYPDARVTGRDQTLCENP
jgi:pimeloyl-ACP methyl ester carboxylesterase